MNEYIQVDTNKSMLDTYVAHFIAEIEKYKRPRPDGSIDWSKAKPNIIELIKVIGGKAYNRGVEDSKQTSIIELKIDENGMQLKPISGCTEANFSSSLNIIGTSEGLYHIEIKP